MSDTTNQVPGHVVLHPISWRTFEALLEDLGDHRGRIAYDRKTFELMSPTRKHEGLKRLIGRLIEILTLELGIEIVSCGSTTLKSKLKKKGVEADECYYVQNEPAVRLREDLDLETDPPPDLAIEVDITRSSVSRRKICAALGIPEVWSHNGEELRVFRLNRRKRYRAATASGVFPMLPLAEFSRFLDMRHTTPETSLVRAFRTWVRKTLLR
jgi:Uma2 family endonuclease